MADNPNSPLRQELSEVQWMRDLLGQGGSSSPIAMNPSQYMVPELSGNELNSMMTNWLRTEGRFLDVNRMAPMAGLYNSSTQKLLQNDLMAQAALKAAMGNRDIKMGNTRTAASIAEANARNKAGEPLSKRRKQEDALLALALAGATQGNNVFNSLGKLGQVGGQAYDWIAEQFNGPSSYGMSDAPLGVVPSGTNLSMPEFETPVVDTSSLGTDYLDASMGGDVVDTSTWGTEDLDWSEIFTDA